MKRHLLALVCLMAMAHCARALEYFSSASDQARLYVGTIEPQYQMGKWYNCPYYKGTPEMYKSPYLSYNLDEYRQFLTLREVLIEYVVCVSRKRVNDATQLVVRVESLMQYLVYQFPE